MYGFCVQHCESAGKPPEGGCGQKSIKDICSLTFRQVFAQFLTMQLGCEAMGSARGVKLFIIMPSDIFGILPLHTETGWYTGLKKNLKNLFSVRITMITSLLEVVCVFRLALCCRHLVQWCFIIPQGMGHEMS